MRLLRFLLMARMLLNEIRSDAQRLTHSQLTPFHDVWVELRTKINLLHRITPISFRPWVEQWFRRQAQKDKPDLKYNDVLALGLNHFQELSTLEARVKTAVNGLRERGLVK